MDQILSEISDKYIEIINKILKKYKDSIPWFYGGEETMGKTGLIFIIKWFFKFPEDSYVSQGHRLVFSPIVGIDKKNYLRNLPSYLIRMRDTIEKLIDEINRSTVLYRFMYKKRYEELKGEIM